MLVAHDSAAQEGAGNELHTLDKMRGRRVRADNMRTARASQKWDSRIPSPRFIAWAIWELVITGTWLQARIKYDDYPYSESDEYQVFCDSMTNVGLLAALMMTVLADMLFNYADVTTVLSVCTSLCILAVMLLYLTSCAWSVFNLMCVSQADGKTEARALLRRMDWRCAMPARLWVYASIMLAVTAFPWALEIGMEGNRAAIENSFVRIDSHAWAFILSAWVEVALCASYLIFQVARVIQFVYACKREAKLREASLVGVGSADKKRALNEQVTRYEIRLSAAVLLADLALFVDHLGAEHLDEDRFLRFLFHKHKSGNLTDAHDELSVRFAPATKARAERFLSKMLEERLEKEIAEHEDALKELATSGWAHSTTE